MENLYKPTFWTKNVSVPKRIKGFKDKEDIDYEDITKDAEESDKVFVSEIIHQGSYSLRGIQDQPLTSVQTPTSRIRSVPKSLLQQSTGGPNLSTFAVD